MFENVSKFRPIKHTTCINNKCVNVQLDKYLKLSYYYNIFVKEILNVKPYELKFVVWFIYFKMLYILIYSP